MKRITVSLPDDVAQVTEREARRRHVSLAERLNTDLIITLDRRHFSAVRPRHCPAFRLLPE